MKDITLLILAAGMGSRYGGLKQLDYLGPNNETIIDYSILDAIEAGFTKIVFVIRKSMQENFDTQILSKYTDIIRCQCVYQELDLLPVGFTKHPERIKPYGTAHAILMAKNAIEEPFAVVNADDFYSKNAFLSMADFLQRTVENELPVFSMIGYKLKNTLSEHGTVSRGVCVVNDNNELVSITEMTKIQRDGNIIYHNSSTEKQPHINFQHNRTELSGEETVSMNFWGFTPCFFRYLEDLFFQFLKEKNDNPNAEFPIPTVINYFITNHIATIKVIDCDAKWFGVTYREDRAIVMKKLSELKR